MASCPPPPSWVVLPTIPRVCAADEDLPPGADVSLELAAPLGVSVLTVAPRISPDVITEDEFPSVLAADRSGLLLLHATQGKRTGRMDFGGGCSWRTFVDGYFVCDAPAATALRLPDPQHGRIVDAGNVGLITAPGGSSYMVAELQPIIGTDLATLLCFSSDTGLWVRKTMSYPLERRPWGSHGVISYQDQLWWVDVSWGLLRCNPFDDEPNLEFVPLSIGKKLPFCCCNQKLDLQKYRCLQVAEGRLCFVEICIPEKAIVNVLSLNRLLKPRRSHRKVPCIVTWTLSDAKTGLWIKEHEVSFEEIWSHRSYKSSGLPHKKVPKLAFMDPENSHILYLFVDEFLFGVDLQERRVEKCSKYNLDYPPRPNHSSRFLHVWELPQGLPASHLW